MNLKDVFVKHGRFACVACAIAVIGAWGLPGAQAQHGHAHDAPAATAHHTHSGVPYYVVPAKPELSTLYHDGSQVTIDSVKIWRPMCGSDYATVNEYDLEMWADLHTTVMETQPTTVVDRGVRSGFDLVFNVGGSVPSGALPGIAMAEAYLEDTFSDPITVQIDVSFQAMGGGVIGATSPYYVYNVTWNSSRTGLVNGMDDDDVVEAYLPSTSYVPVRTEAMGGGTRQEYYVDWTRANYRATVGSASSLGAGMTFNSNFSFDYDPSDGMSGMSFVDVMIHEVGHALGFISGTDGFGSINFTSLDLYRFQDIELTWDHNPDTLTELGTCPRLTLYNAPNDQHISDLISAEYKMSDGDPYQASHFREQSGGSWIGIMDPAFAYYETHYPTFFTDADVNMFDAIGWDYPPCFDPQITQHPQPVTVTEPDPVVLTVSATGDAPMTYRWYRNVSPVYDNSYYSGATTDTLTISPSHPDLSGSFQCLVSNGCGDTFTTTAQVTINPGPTVCLGDTNCDGQIDFSDINPFVEAVIDGIFCDGTGANADMTQDNPTSVGFEDINPFVSLLTTNPTPIDCQ